MTNGELSPAGVDPAIRAMTADDIPLIAEWMVTGDLWVHYDLTVDVIAADFTLALERGDLLLVIDTERPARGFAWCLPTGMFGAFPYLKRIGVDPAVTGAGLGGLLLQEIERRLIETGRRELFLLVSDFNTGAQRFYRRNGYQEIGRLPDLAVSGIDEIFLRKQLVRLA